MKHHLLLAALFSLALTLGFAGHRQDPAALRAEAEAYRAEGSYELARRSWAALLETDLTDDEARAVRTALADCRWRAAAAAERVDDAELEAAREALQEIVEEYARPEDRDVTWARAQASLGDWSWTRRWRHDWQTAWTHYQQALGFWAASPDLDVARVEYLRIAREALTAGEFTGWRQTNHFRSVPLQLAERAQRVAETPDDRAWSSLYLAMALRDRSPSERSQGRIREAFEAAVELKVEPWSERALYHYGVWTEERGQFYRDDEGRPRVEPDYVTALALYRRYLADHGASPSAEYVNSARDRVRQIVDTDLSLQVEGAFLPGGAQVFALRWRNAERVELTLTPVDLGRDVRLASKDDRPHQWLERLDASGATAVRTWTHTTGDDGTHERGSDLLEIPGSSVPSGAYLLQASARGTVSRQLVLISELALALKDVGQEVVAWAADVADGRPRPDAEVTIFHRRDNDHPWKRRTVTTDADGLARFGDLGAGRGQTFAAVRAGDDQAFAIVWGNYRWNRDGEWKLYTTTDRPAYRPGDEVQWKLTARLRESDVFTTPSGRTLRYRLHDPRGNQVAEGPIELSDFGTAWGSVTCRPEWPLGAYSVQFLDDESEQAYGSATLFRLEEYKLPEFSVQVVPATEDDGSPKAFRLGEPIHAEVRAEYTFGGPVAGAKVEVTVHAKSHVSYWKPKRQYPWYFRSHVYRGWGHGEELVTLQLVTDEHGVAHVEFAPESAGESDLEYTFVARVTDSSRREVSGTGTVRASRTAYAMHLRPEHRVYHPGEELEIELEARDPNDAGVAVEGELVLFRQESYEIWRDPSGRRWTGAELERERARYAYFPPAPDGPDGPRWQRLERGEHSEFIGRFPARTDAQGSGRARLAAPREGTYLVRWEAVDRWGERVEAETRAFVASEDCRDLGYRAEGVELHLDRDSLRVGGEAVVLVTTDEPGRWVLFSVEAGGLADLRVVPVDGTAALLRIPVDDRWVPNVVLDAITFTRGRAARDREDIVVPPDDHFLELEVELQPAELGPGETGALVVVAHDVNGEPVEADLSVAVYDSMVEAIQTDLAIDPREFFYGELRRSLVSTGSSFDQLAYRKLVSDGEQGFYDDAWGFDADAEGEDSFLGMRLESGVKKESLGRDRRSAGPSSPATASAVAGELNDMAMPAEAPQGGGPQHEVVVRSDFRDTAFWAPSVRTDANGVARVEWTYPDNLTTWRATARAATAGADFGMQTGESRTTKPLLARVQAPRFLVVGDESVVSVNLNNRTDDVLRVTTQLRAEGVELLGALVDGELRDSHDVVELAGQEGKRLDWLVRATTTGTARFAGTVLGDELSDGVERLVPVVPYGIDALVAASGRVRGDGAIFGIELPAARADGTTEAYVQVAPNLALGLVDALPYLVEYPYGCTEQTLSRFVPAVVVKRTLEDLGLSPEAALERAFGGITPEARAALFDDDHTSLDELDRVVAAGVARLAQAQRGDGAWGWWPGSNADAWMTAYAVWGLALAQDAGVTLEPGMLERGAEWLLANLAEEGRGADMRAWMLHALATSGIGAQDARFAVSFDRAYAERGDLLAYGKALLCLTAARSDRLESARVLSRNLIDGAVRTQPDVSVVQPIASQDGAAAQRAHWGVETGWWRWHQGAIESTAFCLWALLEVDPDHELVEPASQWLMANRRAAQWTNTRDTSLAVLALSSYLARKGNLSEPVEYEVFVNGTSVAHERLEGDELLSGAARIAVPADLLIGGRNEVEVRRISSAEPLDVTVWATFFTQEEEMKPRGNELFVRRQYFRLVGRPTLLEGYVYDRVPLAAGDTVTSGERIECVVSIEAKTNLEYLMLEDLKPAGFEAGGVQSGTPLWASELTEAEARYRFTGEDLQPGVGRRDSGSGSTTGTTGRSRHVHQEWRDRQVGLFLDWLPEGVWEVRYELRAETPGTFHALPLVGQAMYVPEIRANGANLRVRVTD